MPIVVVARQPRGTQAQHQPRLPQAHLGDQPREAAAAVARRTGLPEVVINDLNPFLGPAEQGCTIDQPILQLGALLMLTDLAGGRLAHVSVRTLLARDREGRAETSLDFRRVWRWEAPQQLAPQPMEFGIGPSCSARLHPARGS